MVNGKSSEQNKRPLHHTATLELHFRSGKGKPSIDSDLTELSVA